MKQPLRSVAVKSVLAFIVSATGLVHGPAMSRETARESAGVVALEELPAEARRTHRLILAGGPFPYRKDGTVFGNRERQLPSKPRGYYKEYTVETPGAANRGARRIVCGGQRAVEPDACFYTADHYASFRRIAQ